MTNKTSAKTHKGRTKPDALSIRKDDDSKGQGIATRPHQNTTVFERSRSHLARNLELAFRYASVWVIDYGLLWTLELCIGGETAKYPLVELVLDYTKIAISMFAALMFIIHASINVYKHASEELVSARRIEKP
jgi:hypothetical protein